MPPTRDSNPSRVLSFTDHLQELRVRIIICLVAFSLSFVGGFLLAPRVVEVLVQPLITVAPPPQKQSILVRFQPDGSIKWEAPRDMRQTTSPVGLFTSDHLSLLLPNGERIDVGKKPKSHLIYLSPLEPFFLWIQGALLVSAVVSIPMIVYQLWLFISPGLVRRERRVIRPLLFASILLFPLGASFAYVLSYVALPMLLSFGDAIAGLEANLAATRSVSFVITMMLVSGLLFEFPLVLVLLARLGIVKSHFLVQKRRVAIVLLSIVAAVATPSPDPFTMLLLFAPLVALYEGSVWAIRAMEKASLDRELDE